MSNLKRVNSALRGIDLPDPLTMWKRLLAVAVTSNAYESDVELRVLLYLETGMYSALLTWADAISQQVYGEPMLHYRMHQLAALIRKYPFPPRLSGLTPEKTAVETFLAAEHRCKWVNRRFRAVRSTNRDPMGAVTKHARDWIRYVIGDSVPFSEIYRSCDITPGAAIGAHGNATNLARKLMGKSWTVSPGAYPFALEAIWENSQLVELLLTEEGKLQYCHDPMLLSQTLKKRVELVCYNKIAFVPKTAKTHRSIAVEPFLNTFLQSGVDAVLKRRLQRVGLDLRDQETNAHLAKLGSIDPTENAFCTIDLSSASDTLAREVVRELLPEDWFLFLSSLKSHSYKLGSRTVRYEKFTSMGNGFCFPLESLIFAAIAFAVNAVARRNPVFRVYGDDIIVQRPVFQATIEALKWFGFTPNPRKTFSEGPFRESCGKDWHSGVNVRPVYLDHPLDSWGRIYGFHNQSLRREEYVVRYFSGIRDEILNFIPKPMQLLTPYDPIIHRDRTSMVAYAKHTPAIDGALWVPLDSFMASRYSRWNRDIQAWSFFLLRSRASQDRLYTVRDGQDASLVHHIAALRGSPSRNTFTLRYSAQEKIVRIN